MNKVLIGGLILFLASFITPGFAQDKSERKNAREQKKLEEKARFEKNLKQFEEWIESGEFVILANNITGRYGTVYNLHPTVNFIKVEGNDIVIQTSQPGRPGVNGLGGLTTRGQVSGIELISNEDGKPLSVNVNFSTVDLGAASLNIHVNGNGNATAYLRGNWGQSAIFRGEFAQTDSTLTYEGMQRF